MSRQLPLALSTTPALTRADFIVSPGNAEAVAFVDSWPDWPVPAAALFGPSGCGKSHLGGAWAAQAGATVIDVRTLDDHRAAQVPSGPILLDNVDEAVPAERDGALFRLLNRGDPALLIGRESPERWPVLLPDLASRFHALVSLPLWAPDDALLAALARKLFEDRQLRVSADVIHRMLTALERSPAAIRAFVEKLDQEALARHRRITPSLVSELLA